MKKTILFLLICLINGQLLAQKKRVINHEDLTLLKRVGSPAISPDGKWVVFSVTEPSYDEKQVVNDLWLVPSSGAVSPRKITALKSGENGYAWSPDGSTIAFTTKRDTDEEAQIYLLNIKNGGEAQRFTNIASGASNPRWSPDGKQILFSSNVYPLCFTDSLQIAKAKAMKDLKYKAKVYESFPIRYFDKWLDGKQSHLFVQHMDSTRAKNIFKSISIARGEGFRLENALWSDAENIVFSASTNANTSIKQYTQNNLYSLNLSGKDAIQLSNGNFTYSLNGIDGKNIYFEKTKIEQKTYYQVSQLIKADLPNLQNETNLTEHLDRPITSFSINGGVPQISIEDRGLGTIQTLMGIKNSKQISTEKAGVFSAISASSGVTVALYESAVNPPEVVVLKADGSFQNLSNFNKEKLQQLDLQPIETIWTKTKRGKLIRSMIIKPAKFDVSKKYPLLVIMHGGPSIAFTDSWGTRWNPHVHAQDDLVVIQTDYTGSTGYGEKFGNDIQNDPFKGPAEEVNEAAADAIKRFSWIDGSRQVCGGASYGGHLANWMQATTTHYKALVSHAGLVNSVSQWGTSDGIYSREVMNGGVPWGDSKTWTEQNPIKYAAQFKTPMLMTVGELDYRVPINNTIENWYIHQRLGIPSKLIIFPEENHWILKPENSKFHYAEVMAWWRKWLIN